MSWKDKYDIVNYSFDGDIFLFGGHYNRHQCEEFMQKHGCDYDEMSFDSVSHIYIRFGFVAHEEGELGTGWSVLDNKPDSMRGCIKATGIIYR